jgi:hypothetical protein
MEVRMQPMKIDEEQIKRAKVKTDPAYRQVAEGLAREVTDMFNHPDARLKIECCIEGCCVSWCCIQIS